MRPPTGAVTTMRIMRRILLLVAFMGGWAWPAHAQLLVTNTTLSAALNATDTSFTIGSGTDVAVGSMLYVTGEVMRVVNADTTTIPIVRRGQMGTRAIAHANADVVFVSRAATISAWRLIDPDYDATCTRGTGDAAIQPWINVRTAVIWKCLNLRNIWNGTSDAPITYDSRQTGAN